MYRRTAFFHILLTLGAVFDKTANGKEKQMRESRRLIVFLGGDARMAVAAESLRESGWHVQTWGMTDTDGEATAWQNAVANAHTVILPLPSSADGVRINCPRQPQLKLRFLSLLKELKQGSLILGGRLSPIWIEQAEAAGMVIEDYYESELLQMKNALPTVEGAIMLAMNELPVVVSGSHFSVIGYGRIASLLAEKLHALGGNVTVYARKTRDLAHAELRGFKAVRLMGEQGQDSILEIDPRCRAVFNTVPAQILSELVLRRIPSSCILMELASLPGGFDPSVAERLGLRWILASALPGKCFPESAGRIIAEVIADRLEQLEGIREDATERN